MCRHHQVSITVLVGHSGCQLFLFRLLLLCIIFCKFVKVFLFIRAALGTINDVFIPPAISNYFSFKANSCQLSFVLSNLYTFNRSLLSSGGLMADVPCLDHSLDGCKGRPDDVQTTKHARRTHARSRCTRASLGAHASLFGASGARFWIVTRATSARIEEPSMVSILYIKSSIPDTYK